MIKGYPPHRIPVGRFHALTLLQSVLKCNLHFCKPCKLCEIYAIFCEIYESWYENMNFEELISRCRAAMEAKNMTNRDIARLANISESTVSRTLAGNGQNTSVASLSAICKALEVGDAGAYEVIPTGSSVEELYLARIDDLKHVIASKDKWIRNLFIACAVLMAFVLTMLAIDILNPNVGWVRAALGVGMRHL